MKVTKENFPALLIESMESAAAHVEGMDTRERVTHRYASGPRPFRPAAFRHTGEARRIYRPRLRIQKRTAIPT
jgi:hypothetical protein